MGGLFKSPKMPDPVPVPEIPEPTVMPMPDDATMRKKKESLRAQQQRAGRASTILSTEDKLG